MTVPNDKMRIFLQAHRHEYLRDDWRPGQDCRDTAARRLALDFHAKRATNPSF